MLSANGTWGKLAKEVLPQRDNSFGLLSQTIIIPLISNVGR